jgi:hypothetical protein
MDEWLKEQLASGFADFAGTTLSASIPVKEAFINQLIARYLAQAHTPTEARPIADFGKLAQVVRSASVHAEPGVVTLQFEVAVQGEGI